LLFGNECSCSALLSLDTETFCATTTMARIASRAHKSCVCRNGMSCPTTLRSARRHCQTSQRLVQYIYKSQTLCFSRQNSPSIRRRPNAPLAFRTWQSQRGHQRIPTRIRSLDYGWNLHDEILLLLPPPRQSDCGANTTRARLARTSKKNPRRFSFDAMVESLVSMSKETTEKARSLGKCCAHAVVVDCQRWWWTTRHCG
jgi:hypothetical protein